MFGWRRRSEGFEWREYVRTTVLVRRANRQRRVEDARAAAVEKVKQARDAGVEAGRASASLARSQIVKFFAFIGSALLDLLIDAFVISRRWLKFAFAVASDALGGIAKPLQEAARVPLNAARSAIADLPDAARKLPIKANHIIGAAVILALIYIGGPILRSADGVAVAKFGSETTKEISGRAKAITGDLMRIDDKLVRLDGIEAPAAQQPCYRSNGRRWRCDSAARASLSKLVRRERVTCTPSGHDKRGHILAHCTIDGTKDIAAELVRNGDVFATDSFFNSLSDEEDAARNAKTGIWQGKVVRPAEWRQSVWEAASRDAPGGCPIKGYVHASAKLYAMPWSSGYARKKVRENRGGRWFCSEDEAKAAGFELSVSF
jgi:endonuclease YncB( thermonuclease family)